MTLPAPPHVNPDDYDDNDPASQPDEENPEWTEAMFAAARPATEVLPGLIGEEAAQELFRHSKARQAVTDIIAMRKNVTLGEDLKLKELIEERREGTCTKWLTPEESDAVKAQARALRAQARAGGLRFEAYLPPALAEWLLGLIEQGEFTSPSEATWVMMQEARELEPHADLRHALLQRKITRAIDDPRPRISSKELTQRLDARMLEPRHAPALWQKSAIMDESPTGAD